MLDMYEHHVRMLVAEHSVDGLCEQKMCQHCGAFYIDEEKAARNRKTEM